MLLIYIIINFFNICGTGRALRDERSPSRVPSREFFAGRDRDGIDIFFPKSHRDRDGPGTSPGRARDLRDLCPPLLCGARPDLCHVDHPD